MGMPKIPIVTRSQNALHLPDQRGLLTTCKWLRIILLINIFILSILYDWLSEKAMLVGPARRLVSFYYHLWPTSLQRI